MWPTAQVLSSVHCFFCSWMLILHVSNFRDLGAYTFPATISGLTTPVPRSLAVDGLPH